MFDFKDAGHVLDSTLSYLVVPSLDALHCILEAKSQVDHFPYLRDSVGGLVNRVENVSVQAGTVLSQGLQGQGTCVTLVHAEPGHFLREMTLGALGRLVGVWHIPEPEDYRIRECLPDWVNTGQVLINSHSLCRGEEGP